MSLVLTTKFSKSVGKYISLRDAVVLYKILIWDNIKDVSFVNFWKVSTGKVWLESDVCLSLFQHFKIIVRKNLLTNIVFVNFTLEILEMWYQQGGDQNNANTDHYQGCWWIGFVFKWSKFDYHVFFFLKFFIYFKIIIFFLCLLLRINNLIYTVTPVKTESLVTGNKLFYTSFCLSRCSCRVFLPPEPWKFSIWEKILLYTYYCTKK